MRPLLEPCGRCWWITRGRGSGQKPISLDEFPEGVASPGQPLLADEQAAELLDLNAALDRLAILDERQARIVECRYFGGLSIKETAETLDISTATVKREWRTARAWLYSSLKGSTSA